ncbi:hypothetical protein C8T65DRAFT_744181 [Cerioporus squamosus]|nr:hypothetical protein C8T65DRAFT_744181 [Cerioporus squamosus]
MAPRWLSAIQNFIMKRTRKRAVRVDFYGSNDDDDDDDVHTTSVGCRGRRKRRAPTDRHTHIDRGCGPERTHVQRSYYTLPASLTKPRSSSLPPSLTVSDSTFYDPSDEPIDIEYLVHQLEQLGADPIPRKRTAGDRPLLQWTQEAEVYLDELLRLEGRGEHTSGVCSCGTRETPAMASNPRVSLYRCEDCADISLYCKTCTVASHACHPLHCIREWNGKYFARVTLKSLGLQVQLGHEPGDRCIAPQTPWGDDFVVLDTSGIHELRVRYCGCERALPAYQQLLRARWLPATTLNPKTAATFSLLETFHLLSGQSKVTAFEYYSALAHRTENTGVSPPKDRYPAFLVMAREWRYLKMMKRAGRGNEPGGMHSTPAGSCAVECPACPIPGKNIPADYEEVPRSKSWLYRMFLAIDANFRLKRKKVSSDEADPSLNHGCAYVVEEHAYKAHLKQFDKVKVEGSDHCNNHDAVKLATIKGSASLAATGVVSVDCARHEFKRPCATGDLQQGERYVNTDYVLYSTLKHNTPRLVLASYDIACHFDRKIDTRFERYGLDLSDHELQWAVPKFHINAHREKCLADYNLRYLPGCACSDCEGVERNWSRSNSAVASTKEMGPGSRRDYMDDIWGFHNWGKVTHLPSSLLGKIKKAVPERDSQVAAFAQYDQALPADSKAQWKSAVEAWESDNTQPNPFFIKRPAITQAAIKRQLTEEDAEALKAGTATVLHEKCSASGMIIAGLELEDQQRHLKADIAALPQHATDIARARMQERQNFLRRRFDAWASIQQLYMPATAIVRARIFAASEDASISYNIPLLLPSTAITAAHPALMVLEWRLRYAQAFDALGDLRGHLEVRAHLYKFKDRYARGQRANTHSQTVIKSVDSKINGDAQRYRAAYSALLVLAGPLAQKDWQDSLKPLLATDIRHVTEGEAGQSEGRRQMSWIWRASASPKVPDAAGNMQNSLQESLRVEWCKARARAARWTEEVELVQEEMRRTLAYHKWAAGRWSDLVDAKYADRPDYQEGANAYARRQAAIRTDMHDYCQKSWKDVARWASLGIADNRGSFMVATEAIAAAVNFPLPRIESGEPLVNSLMPSLEHLPLSPRPEHDPPPRPSTPCPEHVPLSPSSSKPSLEHLPLPVDSYDIACQYEHTREHGARPESSLMPHFNRVTPLGPFAPSLHTSLPSLEPVARSEE